MRGLWLDFKKALAAHGLAFPDDITERRTLVRRWALEHSKAMQGILKRDRGLPVDTPPPPAPVIIKSAATATGHRMSDALDAWRASAQRDERTSQTFGRHVETFEQMMGNPPLSTVRRADAVRFRDALQQWAVDNLKTARTADNVMATIKALANIARDREWLEGNPFQRLTVKVGGKASEGREP